MEQILKKLFKKYFIFKITEDWKDELKKIPEELLKTWMDDELFKKIDHECECLASEVAVDADRKWDDDLWMEINDFVNNYELEQENANDTDDDDYWDTDGELGQEAQEEINDLQWMECLDKDENCACDHADVHIYGDGCDTGCAYADHTHCVQYKEKEENVPDEIQETGGL